MARLDVTRQGSADSKDKTGFGQVRLGPARQSQPGRVWHGMASFGVAN